MVTADHGHSEQELPERAAAALDGIRDPVVRVDDGEISYANEAARRAFGLPDQGRMNADDFPEWDTLVTGIDETTVGSVRHLERSLDGYNARIHRDIDGATITFVPAADAASPGDDRTIKARAIDEAPVGLAISDPDRADNPLVYVNDAYQRITGYDFEDVIGENCRLLQGEDSDPETIEEMRSSIETETSTTVEIKNYRKDGTPFWNEVTIAPVYDDDGDLTNYVGFQNDVTARKTAELEAERNREELVFLLERIEGLVQDVTEAVAGSTSRAELADAVCERIAEEDAYEGAWIGERNPSTELIDVQSSAGVTPQSIAADADHPTADALASNTTTVARRDGTTHAAFPLFYNGIEYGVLTVCTAGEREIDDREAVVLGALARAVASGVNARESSRMLATDAVVAVELTIEDATSAPIALSRETGCRLEYRRRVHRTDDSGASLFTVSGTDTEALAAAATALGVDVEVLVERDEEFLIRLESEDNLVSWLSERGVRTESILVDEGRARVSIEIPRSANVRSVIEALETRYDDTDVRSFHHREATGETRHEFAARLEPEFTDRQFSALQRAYLGGYFEWPRPTTGEELAQSMGVSRPTFHEHLRSAEEKLCRAFFGDDSS